MDTGDGSVELAESVLVGSTPRRGSPLPPARPGGSQSRRPRAVRMAPSPGTVPRHESWPGSLSFGCDEPPAMWTSRRRLSRRPPRHPPARPPRPL